MSMLYKADQKLLFRLPRQKDSKILAATFDMTVMSSQASFQLQTHQKTGASKEHQKNRDRKI